ncbi:hypothetical protein L1987_79000 [Smallanthus sonchifolius]|uniref:Uncharacterized protein n=1 Tax=Smallanthus sonchifolius TaxID=185202 RepID=A0ACB8ZF99_9ASTR|nr:hypothetical protein L1987_79000 [Smallanthus sonchifolius]
MSDENDMDYVEVDMRDSKLNVDQDDVVTNEDTNDEVLDNENFYSRCESGKNIGRIRKRKLKYLRKEIEKCF